jgi:hypothetical protein
MIIRYHLIFLAEAVAMSRAALSLSGFVAFLVAFPASVLAELHAAYAGAEAPLIMLEHFKVVKIRTASFDPPRQLCFMELW